MLVAKKHICLENPNLWRFFAWFTSRKLKHALLAGADEVTIPNSSFVDLISIGTSSYTGSFHPTDFLSFYVFIVVRKNVETLTEKVLAYALWSETKYILSKFQLKPAFSTSNKRPKLWTRGIHPYGVLCQVSTSWNQLPGVLFRRILIFLFSLWFFEIFTEIWKVWQIWGIFSRFLGNISPKVRYTNC